MTATTRGSPVGGNESQNQTQNQTPSPNSSNETSPIGPPEEAGQGEAPPTQEEEEPAFPHTDLAKLDEMINRPRWVVPVLPKGELEVLLEAAVDLSKKGPMSRGWLVHLINKFGTLNGFQILHDRFTSGQALNVQIIAALIRPFGQCYEFLTLHTAGKHEAIVKNVHDLLAKLAWDFSPEQLDHLFACFE
ncbi:hypothetical protein cypCar_00045221, partial [Cyprinus carpio]